MRRELFEQIFPVELPDVTITINNLSPGICRHEWLDITTIADPLHQRNYMCGRCNAEKTERHMVQMDPYQRK